MSGVELAEVTGTLVRVPGATIPAAFVLDHGDHTVLVPWAPVYDVPAAALFTLESLVPLTVRDRVKCNICQISGWIQQGAWLPENGGGGR